MSWRHKCFRQTEVPPLCGLAPLPLLSDLLNLIRRLDPLAIVHETEYGAAQCLIAFSHLTSIDWLVLITADSGVVSFGLLQSGDRRGDYASPASGSVWGITDSQLWGGFSLGWRVSRVYEPTFGTRSGRCVPCYDCRRSWARYCTEYSVFYSILARPFSVLPIGVSISQYRHVGSPSFAIGDPACSCFVYYSEGVISSGQSFPCQSFDCCCFRLCYSW